MVEFPSRLMSISHISDKSDRFKNWNKGEYLLLDDESRKIKQKQFDHHCKVNHV